MIFGLRVVLLLGLIAVGSLLLAFFFTRNRRYYLFALKSGKVLFVILAAGVLLYLAERMIAMA